MYKNLSAAGLGIAGRLSELIELSLTHRFKGFDYDLAELITKGSVSALGQARQLLASAKIEFGGFELPVRWRGAEADYKADLAGLAKVAEAAASLGALRTFTTVLPTSDDLLLGQPDGFVLQPDFDFRPPVLRRIDQELAFGWRTGFRDRKSVV